MSDSGTREAVNAFFLKSFKDPAITVQWLRKICHSVPLTEIQPFMGFFARLHGVHVFTRDLSEDDLKFALSCLPEF